MTKQEDSMCVNLVQTVDDHVVEVLGKTTDVKLYKYGDSGKWIPTNMEGMLIFYRRSNNPPFGLLLLSRDSTDNWNKKFGIEVEIQSRPPFLLYKSFDPQLGNCIEALWFSESDRCEDMYKKVRSTTAQPSTLSYAAMVAGARTSESDSNGGEKRSVAEEREMDLRRSAAEDAVKGMHIPGKSLACLHCGKTSHPSESCWKGRDSFQAKKETRGGPVPRGPSQKKTEVSRTLTFEANKHTSKHAEQVAAATSHLFVDSAILESSSSSSQGPPAPLRQAHSPLNFNSLLTHPPASMPHSVSFPSMSEAAGTWSTQNPQLALRVASDQLKGILGMPATPEKPQNRQNGESDTFGVDLSGSSVEETATGPETNRQFAQSVTDRLNGVKDVYPLENGRIYPEMALRPPQHFEGAAAGQSQFLLPEDMECGRFRRNTVSDSSDVTLTGNSARLPAGVNPLTKQQLLQAMDWLLRNDRDFVNKLHEGYIRSLMENLKL